MSAHPASALRALLPARWRERLRARIQRIATEVAEARDLADPEAVRARAAPLHHARAALDELTAELAGLRPLVHALRDAPAPPRPVDGAAALVALREAEIDMLQAGIDRLSSDLVRARDRTQAVAARLDDVVAAAARVPTPAKAPAVCKVPGCDRPVRAKGFCGKHYQQFTRGKLPDFT